MDLEDGLRRYKDNSSYWKFTLEVEQASQKVMADLVQDGDEPTPAALQSARDLLISIEKWKAMCLKSRTGDAQKNPPRIVWKSLLGVLNARSDIEAMLSVMELTGFGSSVDPQTGQRRAKKATAVLRFLKPEDWGVVDWRTCAMLDELNKHNWVIDRAIGSARSLRARDMRARYDIVNEAMVCEVNNQYRARRSGAPLSRAADVDMALFGLSLEVWSLRG